MELEIWKKRAAGARPAGEVRTKLPPRNRPGRGITDRCLVKWLSGKQKERQGVLIHRRVAVAPHYRALTITVAVRNWQPTG